MATAMMMTMIITAKVNPPTEAHTTITTNSLLLLRSLTPPVGVESGANDN